MTFLPRSLAWACVIGVVAVSPAAAQFVTPQQGFAGGLQSVAGRAANPWMYGGGVNPYNPGVGIGINPYAGGGYDPYNSPYFGTMGGGSVAYGQAELLKGYGTAIINQEQARVLREQAMQAKIDTARKRFDFELYVKAMTPTYADEQKKIAKNTLKRIQNNSNPAEISNGKALNILLDDVRMFPLKKAAMDPISMSDDVLKQLNVTTRTAGVGLLRHEGKFNWPAALVDIVPADQLKAIEKQVQIVAVNAAAGKIDAQVLADLNTRMDEIKRTLVKRIDDVNTGKYMEADRFLSDFRDARQGIEEGQMVVQDKFTRFVQGGKTVQEVSDYMVANGLRFAPATVYDEGGYRALHSALVAFDIALNTGPSSSDAEKSQN